MSEDCSPLDDDFTLGSFKDFEDYEAEEDDDDESEDGDDYLCEETSEQPEQFCGCMDENCRDEKLQPVVTSEEELIVTPPGSVSRGYTAVDRSTPMADILSSNSPPETSTVDKKVIIARYKDKGSSFYSNPVCNWGVLDSDSDTEEITTITATAGSTAGSALRTEETAAARRVQDHQAEWHGAISKPIYGWPVRRRAKVADKVADKITDEDEVMSFNFNFEIIPSDEDDGGEEENVELTHGEVMNRKKQKMVPDENGFFDCNPEDVELCQVETRERRYRLRRGVTADSGAGDPVLPKRMVNPKLIKPSAGSRRGLHYVSATNHRIPNQGEVRMDFKTDEGHRDFIVFQVADVNKALMSISDRVDNQCRVVFDQDDSTGEDLTHIFNKKTKQKMRLKRVGKVCVS